MCPSAILQAHAPTLSSQVAEEDTPMVLRSEPLAIADVIARHVGVM